MPSSLHEALIEVFRHRPLLAAELLREACGLDVPDHRYARLHPGDLTDLTPTEYRADAVVTLSASAADVPVLALVVEVQLRRDRGKRLSWPVYLATLRARLNCPVTLLVFSTDPATAAWCARPIDMGHPGWVLCPLVVGPDQVPVVTDPAQASASPELAVLSAMAHATHPDRNQVLNALAAGLATVEPERATLYSDVVYVALPAAARKYLEDLMTARTYEYQSDFVRRYVLQGRAEGKAEGEAEAVLAVLDERGIDVPSDIRARITSCSDLDQLSRWVRRAVTANTIDDLFD